jgi:hypothetical protein
MRVARGREAATVHPSAPALLLLRPRRKQRVRPQSYPAPGLEREDGLTGGDLRRARRHVLPWSVAGVSVRGEASERSDCSRVSGSRAVKGVCRSCTAAGGFRPPFEGYVRLAARRTRRDRLSQGREEKIGASRHLMTSQAPAPQRLAPRGAGANTDLALPTRPGVGEEVVLRSV